MTVEHKTCNECNRQLPLSAYHKDKYSHDGHQRKCKDCKKKINATYFAENRDYFRDYHRQWLGRPGIAEARSDYMRTYRHEYKDTEIARKLKAESNKRAKIAMPLRMKARSLVTKAVESGRIKKLPCFVCGEQKVQAHHADYDQPLDVIWLCKTHHEEVHNMLKPFARSRTNAAIP